MNAQPQPQRRLSRRGALGLGGGVALTLAAGGSLRAFAYERLRWGEDFFPGAPPEIALEPAAWTTAADRIRFAVLGDNGSGGRNQMDVARQMARTYRKTPYGLVLLAGDISYYGSIDDRWNEVFVEPYRPLIDAGVSWELAIGNHEISEKKSDDAVDEIQAQLRRFGKPGTYYSTRHGPVEVFVLDTSIPQETGAGGPEQVAWLEQALRYIAGTVEGRPHAPPPALLGPARLVLRRHAAGGTRGAPSARRWGAHPGARRDSGDRASVLLTDEDQSLRSRSGSSMLCGA